MDPNTRHAMSATLAAMDELRKRVDANIAAQHCAENMGRLMRTDAQKMQAQLFDLYKERMCRESMIAFFSRCIKKCESKLQEPKMSDDKREKCVIRVTKHKESVEHHSKRLQDIEKEIQNLGVSKELAEEAMAKVLDEKRQYLEKDDLEADLDYYYAEYRYHRDEAEYYKEEAEKSAEAARKETAKNLTPWLDNLEVFFEAGQKMHQKREQRDHFLQKIGETEERIAKKRRCSPVGL